jgi:hypothetical protein
MSPRVAMEDVRLPRNEEPIAAVTILDRNGAIIGVVPATEFRRAETTIHVRPRVGREAARSKADRARRAA